MVVIQFPPLEKNSIPVVLLGYCYKDNRQFQLAESSARRLHGDNKRFQLKFLRAFGAQPSALGTQIDGTVSDIHSIGRVAAKQGWKRFIVFDALTHLQLVGKTEFGRNKIPTAIVVALKRKGNLKPEDCVESPEFVITRMRWKVAFKEAGKQSTSRCAAPTPHTWSATSRIRNRDGSMDDANIQMVIRDPLAIPFSDYEEQRVELNELCSIFSSTQPPLPPETVWQILEELNYSDLPMNRLSDIVDESESQSPQTADTLPIICLAALTEVEEHNLRIMFESRLAQCWASSPSIRFVRWRHQFPANRRDMMRVYSHARMLPQFSKVYVFLHELAASYEDVRMIQIDSKENYPDVCVNMKWEDGLYSLRRYNHSAVLETNSYNHTYQETDGTVEYLPQANQTFPPITSSEQLRETNSTNFWLHVYIACCAQNTIFQALDTIKSSIRAHGPRDGDDAAHWPSSTTPNIEPPPSHVVRTKNIRILEHDIRHTCEHTDNQCNRYVFSPHAHGFMKVEGLRTAVIADGLTARDRTVLVLELSDGGEFLHARIPATDAYDFGYQCGTHPHRTLTEWAEDKDVKVYLNNVSRGVFRLKKTS